IQASAMVRVGKRMWNPMFRPNWARERSRTSSMGAYDTGSPEKKTPGRGCPGRSRSRRGLVVLVLHLVLRFVFHLVLELDRRRLDGGAVGAERALHFHRLAVREVGLDAVLEHGRGVVVHGDSPHHEGLRGRVEIRDRAVQLV